ncbi:hypothetical protein PVT67_04470 [Gallaecimonas kandeliae]|uniref:DUF6587 family protein n=1 Tax=Gallaecimonas kandeliae TaxID=3029055 RepID=UPI00264721F4|nr:DUF6587 family protein [Gallaecimonas kandeliae]WKE66511.1 hypothetical protein PVT67_04470 [Gallaecimonas kandeliae]
MLFELIQTLVIASLLAWSGLVVARKLAPGWLLRAQGRLAAGLLAPGRGLVARRLGLLVMPKIAAQGGCGSGGCGPCQGCAPAPSKDPQEILRVKL